MYALVTGNEITKFINHPKAMVIGDVQYPAKIFSVWSESELNAIGIYEVVFDDSNKKDEKWYINTNQSYDFDGNEVTASYGTATPKAHADSLWTQDEIDDGDAPEGTSPGDVKTRGLKYNLIQTLKQQVANWNMMQLIGCIPQIKCGVMIIHLVYLIFYKMDIIKKDLVMY